MDFKRCLNCPCFFWSNSVSSKFVTWKHKPNFRIFCTNNIELVLILNTSDCKDSDVVFNKDQTTFQDLQYI